MKFLARLLPFAPFLPAVAFAQANLTYLTNFFQQLSSIVNNILVPFVFALALLAFLIGAFYYFFLGGGDEEKRKTGRTYMIYAIVAFAVMVAIYGIVELLISIFGITPDQDIQIIPNAPTGQR